MSPVIQQRPFPICPLALPAIVLAARLLGRRGSGVPSIPVCSRLVLEVRG